jgi:hypothetical protein
MILDTVPFVRCYYHFLNNIANSTTHCLDEFSDVPPHIHQYANVISQKKMNYIWLQKIDPTYDVITGRYIYELSHGDIITSVFIPQDMTNLTLMCNGDTICKFTFNNISDTPSLIEVLEESKRLPVVIGDDDSQTLNFILWTARQLNNRILYNRLAEEIYDQHGIKYIRRKLILPSLPII